MSSESIITHITPVGGKIFADLGFEPDEAAKLLAETDAIISEKLAIKVSLMTELAGWIEAKKLKQAEAAVILCVTLLNRRHNELTQHLSPPFRFLYHPRPLFF